MNFRREKKEFEDERKGRDWKKIGYVEAAALNLRRVELAEYCLALEWPKPIVISFLLTYLEESTRLLPPPIRHMVIRAAAADK